MSQWRKLKKVARAQHWLNMNVQMYKRTFYNNHGLDLLGSYARWTCCTMSNLLWYKGGFLLLIFSLITVIPSLNISFQYIQVFNKLFFSSLRFGIR